MGGLRALVARSIIGAVKRGMKEEPPVAKKAIPNEVRKQVDEIVAKFNREVLGGRECCYVTRYRGRFLYLDRNDFGNTGPICRLEYRGSIDRWWFAIFKYSSETYSDDELFPGDQHVDGTVEGAMRAGLEAYPA